MFNVSMKNTKPKIPKKIEGVAPKASIKNLAIWTAFELGRAYSFIYTAHNKAMGNESKITIPIKINVETIVAPILLPTTFELAVPKK